MTLQELKSGQEFDFNSEDHSLNVSYMNKHSLFYCIFNAKFFSFKTFAGVQNKSNYFINKYNLKQTHDTI